MDKKIAILLIVIFLFGGFWVGKIYEKNLWQEKFYDVVRQELDWVKSQTELCQYLQDSLYHVSGTVIEKREGFLTIEGQTKVNESALSGVNGRQTRKIDVEVTEETEIFRAAESKVSGEKYQKVPLNFEDIEAGNYLLIISKENAVEKQTITAEKMQVSDSEL